jgi:hypothetical protein
MRPLSHLSIPFLCFISFFSVLSFSPLEGGEGAPVIRMSCVERSGALLGAVAASWGGCSGRKPRQVGFVFNSEWFFF